MAFNAFYACNSFWIGCFCVGSTAVFSPVSFFLPLNDPSTFLFSLLHQKTVTTQSSWAGNNPGVFQPAVLSWLDLAMMSAGAVAVFGVVYRYCGYGSCNDSSSGGFVASPRAKSSKSSTELNSGGNDTVDDTYLALGKCQWICGVDDSISCG